MAFVGVAYAFGVTMAGTTLPTPLYPAYEQQLGFGNFMTTIIYAVYASGVLAALVFFGRAFDVLGRRPLLLAGLACSILSALAFLTDAGLVALFVRRVLSGLSAGIFTGTATVALVELAAKRRRGQASTVASAVNMFGLGCGPLLAGLLAAFAPMPLRLPYIVHLGLVALAVVAVWLAPETVRRQPGARPRPQLPSVPAQARAAFVPASTAAFAAFAVFGLVTAIEPAFLSRLLHLPSPALSGTIVFAMFAGSAVGQVGLARLPDRVALPTGCLVLIAGLVGIGGALATDSLAMLIAGTVIVGLGQGISFRAGIAAVTAASPPEQRAGTVSAFFVVAYLGISVPVILVGLASEIWGLRTAGITFSAAMGALTIAAFIAVLWINHVGQREPIGSGN